MAAPTIRPHVVVADENGNIFDHPDLLLLCRRGDEWAQPRPDELIPLPEESELFLLPGRQAVGLDPESGETEVLEELAVAAFISPGYTLAAHPAYVSQPDAPELPLFAYGAVGFAANRFYVCAKRVDEDPRQVFKGIQRGRVEREAKKLIAQYPNNRLMQHLMNNCVLRYACPAARNLALGRYEAPLPTSRVCNARCVGCISHQDKESGICTAPQSRLTFTPSVDEVVEVMLHHGRNETQKPIYSFGQGCEGEPLTQADLLIAGIRRFRAEGGRGTVNLNSNASMPEAVIDLAEAGLSSLRASLNSARPEVYERYYRPNGYTFDHVRRSMTEAAARGVHVALNLLYFPGITDTEGEVDALIELIRTTGAHMVQLRNLNIDPESYPKLMQGIHFGPSAGLNNFRKRLKRACPGLEFGYFNPWIPEGGTARRDYATEPPLSDLLADAEIPEQQEIPEETTE